MSRIITIACNVATKVAAPRAASTAVSRATGGMMQTSVSRVNAASQAEASKASHITQRLSQTADSLQKFSKDMGSDVYQLCAVPKKKISPHKRRLRNQGQWVQKAKTLHKIYQMCLACNKPMIPHTICGEGKKCMSSPRI